MLNVFGHNKYCKILSKTIFSSGSSDITKIEKKYLKKKLIGIGIENNTPVESQFVYAFIIAKTQVFLAKKYLSKKKYQFNETKAEHSKMFAYINSYKIGLVSQICLYNIFNKQVLPENPSINFSQTYTKLVAWHAPLFFETFGLKTSETASIKNIPMSMKYFTKDNLLPEINFWIFFHEFLAMNYSTCYYLKMNKYAYVE